MHPIVARTTLLLSAILVSPVFAFQSIRRYHGRINETGLYARMKNKAPSRIADQTEYVEIDANGDDAWRTMDAASLLGRGGLGIIPTEMGYGFVCPLMSKTGLERMLRIKETNNCKRPMTLLCSDLATIDEYCFGIDRGVFKTLKKNLPGSYRFILPGKSTLPKGIIFESKGGKSSFARQTIGVGIPTDPILRYVQDELLDKAPLLMSPLPIDDDMESDPYQLYLGPDASWFNDLDFVVNAGERPGEASTDFDLSNGAPTLVKEGLGELELVA
mmetsp:Transcript_20105/g.49353  ORF Transcript_20105/g.49353 Transcript_20105/m.49353 type:complete len:273 (+) Transcript_20105:1243-2061(+)